MKVKQNRLVDSHASNIMSGYRRPELGAINKIWPIIDVDSETGKFFEFAADTSVIRLGLERALGDERKRIDILVGEGSFSADEVSLEIPLYDRELKNVPETRQQRYRDQKARTVQGVHLLGLEYAAAQILKNPAKYDVNVTETLAGTDQWSDTANSKPYLDLRRWLRTMKGPLGVPVSALSVAFAPKPWEALQDHPDTDNKLKFRGTDMTPAWLAEQLGCKEVVNLDGLYASAFDPKDPKNVTFSEIFEDEVIVFLEIADPGVGDPLWGGVARVGGYPIATTYRDEPRSAEVMASDDNYGIFQQSNRRGFLAKAVSGL